MSYVPQIRLIGQKHWYGDCRFATREDAQAWFSDRTDVETRIIESHYKPNQKWVNGEILGRGRSLDANDARRDIESTRKKY